MKKLDGINQWLKELDGSLIGIGLEKKKWLETIMDNDKISSCDLLESVSLEEESKKKRNKVLPVRKLRKKFKKKRHDYMLIHMKYITPYLKHVIKDTIYITKKEIRIYGVNQEELELLKKRYSRYQVFMKIIQQGKDCILVIDCSKAKNYYFKDRYYYLLDTIYSFNDMITKFLIN